MWAEKHVVTVFNNIVLLSVLMRFISCKIKTHLVIHIKYNFSIRTSSCSVYIYKVLTKCPLHSIIKTNLVNIAPLCKDSNKEDKYTYQIL